MLERLTHHLSRCCCCCGPRDHAAPQEAGYSPLQMPPASPPDRLEGAPPPVFFGRSRRCPPRRPRRWPGGAIATALPDHHPQPQTLAGRQEDLARRPAARRTQHRHHPHPAGLEPGHRPGAGRENHQGLELVGDHDRPWPHRGHGAQHLAGHGARRVGQRRRGGGPHRPHRPRHRRLPQRRALSSAARLRPPPKPACADGGLRRKAGRRRRPVEARRRRPVEARRRRPVEARRRPPA